MDYIDTIFKTEEIKNIQNLLKANIENRTKIFFKVAKYIYVLICLSVLIYALNISKSQWKFYSVVGDIVWITCFYVVFLAILTLILRIYTHKIKQHSNVREIVSVTAQIVGHTTSYTTAQGANASHTNYFLNILSASKPITTNYIHPFQSKHVERLKAEDPEKVHHFRVAVVEPSFGKMLSGVAQNGSILLLPFERYIDPNGEVDFIEYEEGVWIGPKQFGYEPRFNTPRKEVAPARKNQLVCEENIDLNKDHTNFEEDHDPIINDAKYNSHTLDDFMDMRVAPESIKGNVLSKYFMMLLAALITNFFFMDDIYLLPDVDFVLYGVIFFIFLILVLFLVFLPLKVKTPIRFNRKNREVYAYHKGSLYRVPWDKVDMSVVAKQSLGNHIKKKYDLILWLRPEYDVTGKSTTVTPLTILSSEALHGKVYYCCDYIIRYMRFDSSVQTEEQGEQKSLPSPDESKKQFSAKKVCKFVLNTALFVIFAPIAIFFILFVFSPISLRIKFNPFKIEWPEKVHEWSGKRSSWH